jgi:hypothetical protein
VVEALTAPVTFMLLGLPARTYSVILALLAVNAVTLCTFSFQLLASPTGVLLNVVVAVCAAAVLVSCAVRSISAERSRRALFLLHCSLSARSQLLSDDVSVRRYREVLLANRELYGIGATAQDKGSKRGGGGGGGRGGGPPVHRARQHVALQHVARAVTVN